MRVRLSSMAGVVALAACGARTGLLTPDLAESGTVASEMDAAAEAMVESDAPAFLDVQEEPFVACPDAGNTLIYVITTQNVLMSFYPPTAAFATIGTIQCPGAGGDAPLSMAVDRKGTAYVMFNGGTLFRVSTADGLCTTTAFVHTQQGIADLRGMGFVANPIDAGTVETLYVENYPAHSLDTLDTTTFQLTTVAPFDPAIIEPELTGTGAGDLFFFYATSGGADSAIAQIDRYNAQILGVASLPGVPQGGGWAFAFWGGDFYMFTAPQGLGTSSLVTRYRPADGTIKQVAASPDGLTIVGAGTSTCAPQ